MTKEIGLKASDFTLKFGNYRGKKLDEVPLRYLDWLLGQKWLDGITKSMVTLYIKDPAIAKELERELERNETD